MFKVEDWFTVKQRSYGQELEPRLFKMGFAGLLVLIVLMGFFGSWGIIGSQERGVKVRLGVIQGVVNPGPYMKWPFIEQVVTMDVKVQSLVATKDAPLSAASNDLQDTKLAVVVNYSLNPSTVMDVYQQYGSADRYYSNVVEPLIVATVKAVASQYTASDQIQKRSEMTGAMVSELQKAFADKNVTINKADITDISFSPSFTEAIEKKVTAVQNAEAAKNLLEQVKYEKEQTIAKAQGEAEAIRIQAQAINSQGGADYVELQKIQKWNGMGCTSYCGLQTSTGLLVTGK